MATTKWSPHSVMKLLHAETGLITMLINFMLLSEAHTSICPFFFKCILLRSWKKKVVVVHHAFASAASDHSKFKIPPKFLLLRKSNIQVTCTLSKQDLYGDIVRLDVAEFQILILFI